LIIYTGFEDYFTCWENNWEEIEIELGPSCRVVVRPLGYNRATILRIITTDPQHYLRSELQPGNEIELPLNYARN